MVRPEAEEARSSAIHRLRAPFDLEGGLRLHSAAHGTEQSHGEDGKFQTLFLASMMGVLCGMSS